MIADDSVRPTGGEETDFSMRKSTLQNRQQRCGNDNIANVRAVDQQDSFGIEWLALCTADRHEQAQQEMPNDSKVLFQT
jgi:hypothetical protein